MCNFDGVILYKRQVNDYITGLETCSHATSIQGNLWLNATHEDEQIKGKALLLAKWISVPCETRKEDLRLGRPLKFCVFNKAQRQPFAGEKLRK